MLKQVTVTITVDDHEPEKCGVKCQYYEHDGCNLFNKNLLTCNRCKECLEEGK